MTQRSREDEIKPTEYLTITFAHEHFAFPLCRVDTMDTQMLRWCKNKAPRMKPQMTIRMVKQFKVIKYMLLEKRVKLVWVCHEKVQLLYELSRGKPKLRLPDKIKADLKKRSAQVDRIKWKNKMALSGLKGVQTSNTGCSTGHKQTDSAVMRNKCKKKKIVKQGKQTREQCF